MTPRLYGCLVAGAALKESEVVCLKQWRERGLRGMSRAYPQIRDHGRNDVTNGEKGERGQERKGKDGSS
jgi:hypothetical protein